MFSPTRDSARRFLIDAWRKYREGQPLTPLETIAVHVAVEHPEYHKVLEDTERYVDRDYTPESGETNPFLHISLHLALEEQLSIDQPAGVRAQFQRLAEARGDAHEAKHAMIDCLGEMIWHAQRHGTPPDPQIYFACMARQ